MSTHHSPRSLLSPLMRGVLDRMHRAGRPPLHALSPEQARAFYEAGASVLDLAPHRMARDEAVQIPVRDGATLGARLWVPHGRPDQAPDAEAATARVENQGNGEGEAGSAWPVLLYLHGGGFMVGSSRTHASLCRHLAHLAHCAVLSVDYRLAPEYRFPTAVHDAWDALQWLHAEAAALGLDPQRLAIGGDSAGGTLSLVTAVQARDAGLPLRLQLLFYPGCTAHQETASHQQFRHGFLIEGETIAWFFAHYLEHSEQAEDWRFAPLLTPDLEGVAPAWFALAECDPLVDEGVLMADRLRMAGVAVDLEIYRGVTHEFIKMGRAIPEALQAHQDAARALRAALA